MALDFVHGLKGQRNFLERVTCRLHAHDKDVGIDSFDISSNPGHHPTATCAAKARESLIYRVVPIEQENSNYP